MREKARDFFEEAKLLAAAKKYNGAASRLYYALYHGMTSVFEEKGIEQSDLTSKDDPGYWMHEVVVNNFTLAGIDRRERETIRAVWRLRGVADYEMIMVKEIEIGMLIPKVKAILIDIGIKI